MTTRRTLLAAGVATLAAPAFMRHAMAATTVFDLATVWPEGNFHTKNARRFAEEVEKETGGQVKINVQAGGSLGFKGPELLRSVRDGLVPMADVLNNQQIGDEPLMGVQAVPFLVGSMDELKVLAEFEWPEMVRLAQKNNQKFLYTVPWPTQYTHLKRPIATIDDLKGLRLRSSDKATADMANMLGAAGTMMPWGEVVPALASGRIEGVFTSATSGVDGRFWEFLKVAYRTNHTFSSQIVSIGLDYWNKLSAENRAKIEAVAKRLQPEFWNVAAADDTASVKKLQEGGMSVLDVDPAVMTEMRRRTVSARDDFIKRVPAAKPVITAYLTKLGRA